MARSRSHAGAVQVGDYRQRYQRDFCRPGHPLYADRARAILTTEHARMHYARVSLVAAAGQAPIPTVISDQLAILAGHQRPRQCYGRGHGCGDRSRAEPC